MYFFSETSGSEDHCRRVRTLYACVGEHESELSFEPNQVITDGNFLKLNNFFSAVSITLPMDSIIVNEIFDSHMVDISYRKGSFSRKNKEFSVFHEKNDKLHISRFFVKHRLWKILYIIERH